MAREAVVEALLGEGAHGRDQVLLPIEAFLGEARELGNRRKREPRLLGLVDRLSRAEVYWFQYGCHP